MQEEEEDKRTIVVHLESYWITTGFSGDDSPIAVFPAVVGRPKDPQDQRVFVGDEALAKRRILNLSYPIQHGIITNWDDLQAILDHLFKNELRVNCEEFNVLATDCVLNPKANREKLTQVMFERFNVPNFYIAKDAMLVLFASGRTTGSVIMVHSGSTFTVSLYEGYCLPHAVLRSDIGGVDHEEYLRKLLGERSYTFSTPREKEIVSDIYKKHAYIALDYDAELVKARSGSEIELNYEMPDGQIITIGKERFQAPEMMLKPDLYGATEDGIHKQIYQTIMKCDQNISRDLYSNIILSGRYSMTSGLPERLNEEIRKLAPDPNFVKVIAPPEREYGVWIGGAIVSSLSTFQTMWITKSEYNESGPGIVHRKCF